MIIIDQEKCIGCEVCVKDCFGHNLEVIDRKAQVKGNCFQCGHCVAVCPQNAIGISNLPSDIVEYSEDTCTIPSENLLNAIKSRRSVRHYKKQAVEQEKLERILQAGRYTATGSNAQDVAYIVVQKDLDNIKPFIWDGLMNLADRMIAQGTNSTYAYLWKKMYEEYKNNPMADGVFLGAPVLLVVTANSSVNGILAASNIELMANAEGLGCLYSGFIERGINNSKEASQELGVKDKPIAICMLLGYPDIKYKRSAPKKQLDVQWR